MKAKAIRESGYVLGRCSECGEEELAVLMFEDNRLGVECMACGHIREVDEIEWIE